MTPAGTDAPLRDRVVLVTGAGSGIGAGIARVLAARGALVAVNDRVVAAAEETVRMIADGGGTAFAAPGDITDETEAAAVIARAVAETGRLDGVVNNAGITGRPHIDEIDRAMWDRVLDVNLGAPFRLAVLAAPHLRSAGAGRIVNIASIAGTRISVLGGAAYTASKAGLIGLTRHLAMEFARDGITVNAVLPGVVATPLVRAATSAEQLEHLGNTVPVGRVGDPEDIGNAVAFLLDPASSYVSGTALEVDGAMTVLPGDYSGYGSMRDSGGAA